MDTDDMTTTHEIITGWLNADEDRTNYLFGFTLGTLRMFVQNPENETLRQQALDIIRAVDDHRETEAIR